MQSNREMPCSLFNVVLTIHTMQVSALQKGFLTLSDALLEELGEPMWCTTAFFLDSVHHYIVALQSL